MAKFSPAVIKAQSRRTFRDAKDAVEIESYVDNVLSVIKLRMGDRVSIATELVRNQVVKNISRPVTKTKVKGRIVVTDRSKPGEFPKADSTNLRKTIFGHVIVEEKRATGYVGTPVDYGVILELERNRSFLVRTLNEQRALVMKILTGPLKP